MKYQANPVVVDAEAITVVGEKFGDGSLPLQLGDGSWVNATPGMIARMMPRVGDYWVKQSDGYIYLNPKDVFERKYSPCAQVAV